MLDSVTALLEVVVVALSSVDRFFRGDDGVFLSIVDCTLLEVVVALSSVDRLLGEDDGCSTTRVFCSEELCTSVEMLVKSA